jgi:hypothetical protein
MYDKWQSAREQAIVKYAEMTAENHKKKVPSEIRILIRHLAAAPIWRHCIN